MARLIRRALASKLDAQIDPRICEIFVLAELAEKLPPDPNRVPIEAWGAGSPIGVPRVLLVQLKKDLGERGCS